MSARRIVDQLVASWRCRLLCLTATLAACLPQAVWPQDASGQARSGDEPPRVETGVAPQGDSDKGGAMFGRRTPDEAPKHAHHLRLAAGLEEKGQLEEARSIYLKALDSEAKWVRDQAEAGIQRIDARKRSLRHRFVVTPLKVTWSFVRGASPVAVLLTVIYLFARRRARGTYVVEGFADAPAITAAFAADLREFIDRSKVYYKPRELWLAGQNDSVALVQWSTGLLASPALVKALADVGAPGLGGAISEILVKSLLAPEYRISGSVLQGWRGYHVRATLSRKEGVLGSWQRILPAAKPYEALAQLAYEVAVRLVRQAGGK